MKDHDYGYYAIGTNVVFVKDDDVHEGVVLRWHKSSDGSIIYDVQNDRLYADVYENQILGEIAYLDDEEEKIEEEN